MSASENTQGWTKKNLDLLRKASGGNEEAQYNLGLHYMKGEGLQQDIKMAVEWLTKSADQGFEDAEYLLGTCYENGTGVPRDLAKALTLYVKSGNAANKYAQHALGQYYTYESNFNVAMEWFQKAARQQYPPSQYELGRSYYYGLGRIKDEKMGLEFITKAANKNYQPALELLPTLGK